VTPASLTRDLTAFSIQIGLLAVVVAVLMTLVRVPARIRYVCLRLALVAGLMLPWLLRAPAIPHPVVLATTSPSSLEPVDRPARWTVPAPKAAPAPIVSLPSTIPWPDVIAGVLLAGFVLRGLWLAVGLLRLRRMNGRATEVDLPEYAELQEQLGTAARIARVDGLTQPATFGVRKPVILLPATLEAAPFALRRAVVTHELFHVRRRDWLSVLGEELLRTVLWFHPAIFWLTASIQLAREEIVDELSVRLTGDRRTYMQALLVFADSAGRRPAPAFAHRRQLFHRIVSVSKEKAMSAPRIVMSTGVLVAAVVATSWYASAVFPIVSAAPAVPSPTARSTPPPQLPVAAAVPIGGPPLAAVQASATANTQSPRQVTPENPIPRRTRGAAPAWPARFAREHFGVVVSALVTLDHNGRVVAVDRSGCSVTQRGNETAVCRAFFDATAAAIRQWQYARPAQAPIQFTVMTSFRPGAEPAITQGGSDWLAYVRETQDSLRVLAENTGGVAVTPAPSASTEDFLKSQLVRLASQLREVERAHRLVLERYNANHPDVEALQQQYARLGADLARAREQLSRVGVAEATARDADANRRQDEEALRARLREVEAALQAARSAQERAGLEASQRELDAAARALEAAQTARLNRLMNADVSTTVGPPQARAADDRPLRAPSGRAPVRVGGAIAPPRVLEQAKPVYTQEAMAARVEGTVVLEIIVDERGFVPDARVVRSIPLLDQSALEAVKQWRFTPTLVDGQALPVIVQVEMTFTLK